MEVLERYGTITVSEDRLLCKKAPIDEAVQVVVSECYKKTILDHGYCPTLAGNRGTRRVYNAHKSFYYWLHMAFNVRKFVFRCEFCRRHKPSQKQQRWLQLFSPSTPLQFVAINILRSLTMQKHGSRFLIVITDQYNKLKRAVFVRKITQVHRTFDISPLSLVLS